MSRTKLSAFARYFNVSLCSYTASDMRVTYDHRDQHKAKFRSLNIAIYIWDSSIKEEKRHCSCKEHVDNKHHVHNIYESLSDRQSYTRNNIKTSQNK